MALATNRLVKWVLILLLSVTIASAENPKQNLKNEVRVCTRWTWVGDVYNRKLMCLEWTVKDCSNRLHQEICKAGG